VPEFTASLLVEFAEHVHYRMDHFLAAKDLVDCATRTSAVNLTALVQSVMQMQTRGQVTAKTSELGGVKGIVMVMIMLSHPRRHLFQT